MTYVLSDIHGRSLPYHQMLKRIRFSEEDQLLVKRLFSETNVLSAIYHYYQLQNIG